MGKGKKNSQKHRIETFTGSFYSVNFTATTNWSGALSPNNTALFGNRVNAMSQLFNLYRFTSVKFSWCNSAQDVAVALITGILTTPPTTMAQISEQEYVNISRAPMTVLTHLNVPRSFLLGSGAAKWWKTVPDAGQDDWDELQGEVFGFASASATLGLVVEYVIEFTAFAADANTPMPRPVALKNKVGPKSSTGPCETPAPSGSCADPDSPNSGVQSSAADGYSEEEIAKFYRMARHLVSPSKLRQLEGSPGL